MNDNFTPIKPPIFCPLSNNACVEECSVRMLSKGRDGKLMDCCGIALIARGCMKDAWYPLVRTIPTADKEAVDG